MWLNFKTYGMKFIIVILTLLTPISTEMIAVGVLIIIDLLFGITASIYNGIKFESKKLKFSAVKMLIYNLLIISSFVAETYMAEDIPFIKVCLAFLATIEITSIGESFQKITGLSFIKFLKNFINQQLNKTSKDD